MWEKEEDKKYYQDRKIDGLELYIPIKYDANLSLILKHQNWWDVFTSSDLYTLDHELFSFRLMDKICDKIKVEMKNGEIKKDIKDYDKVGNLIMNCWEGKWKESCNKEDSTFRYFSYNDRWMELFANNDEKSESK